MLFMCAAAALFASVGMLLMRCQINRLSITWFQSELRAAYAGGSEQALLKLAFAAPQPLSAAHQWRAPFQDAA
jgi:hypothetical protein